VPKFLCGYFQIRVKCDDAATEALRQIGATQTTPMEEEVEVWHTEWGLDFKLACSDGDCAAAWPQSS
jgi:hypothetical protein